jgi:hypothetical protein
MLTEGGRVGAAIDLCAGGRRENGVKAGRLQ